MVLKPHIVFKMRYNTDFHSGIMISALVVNPFLVIPNVLLTFEIMVHIEIMVLKTIKNDSIVSIISIVLVVTN